MKKTITILLFINAISSFSQTDTTFIIRDKTPFDDTLNYVTDTLVSEGVYQTKILTGTTILPMSRNNIGAIGYGFTLTNIESTPCKQQEKNTPPPRLKDSEVVSIIKTDSNWICELKIVENCCYDFLCEIKIENDSVLDFIYTGYGDHCGCNCCFGLTYHIKIDDFGDVNKITHTKLNGKDESLQPIK